MEYSHAKIRSRKDNYRILTYSDYSTAKNAQKKKYIYAFTILSSMWSLRSLWLKTNHSLGLSIHLP